MDKKQKDIFQKIQEEIARQEARWGSQEHIPDDRWMEIAEDEFKDLKWATRTVAEINGHTIEKERNQLISVLIRWQIASKKR